MSDRPVVAGEASGVPLVALSEPKGTVVFERNVQIRPYHSAKASISIQFPVTFDDEEATMSAAKDAFFQAKTVIFDQLGIPITYDAENGVIREVIEATFGPTEVVNEAAASVPAVTPTVRTVQEVDTTPPPKTGEPVCPKCKGPMWDNRDDNAERRQNNQALQPDWRCKNYKKPPAGTGCKGVIWPPDTRN